MKVNSNKCYLSTNKQSCMNLKIGYKRIGNSTCEKHIVVKLDNKLNFNEHLNTNIKKKSRKVSTLSKISFFMNLTKTLSLMNSFFTTQFSHTLPIWMCHSRTVNIKINKLHERSLRIIMTRNYFIMIRNRL